MAYNARPPLRTAVRSTAPAYSTALQTPLPLCLPTIHVLPQAALNVRARARSPRRNPCKAH